MDRTAGNTTVTLLYDFLLALYIALVGRWVMVQMSWSHLEDRMAWRVNARLHRLPDANIGGLIVFFAISVGLAFIILVTLRLLRASHRFTRVLAFTAGPICVALLPVAWLLVAHVSPPPPGLPNPPHALLIVELSVVTLGVAICAHSSGFVRNSLAALLLVAHFVFWGWVFLGGLYVWLDPVKTVFPLVALGSSLAWFVGPRPLKNRDSHPVRS